MTTDTPSPVPEKIWVLPIKVGSASGKWYEGEFNSNCIEYILKSAVGDRLELKHKNIHNESCELLSYIENFLKSESPSEQIHEEIKRSMYKLIESSEGE